MSKVYEIPFRNAEGRIFHLEDEIEERLTLTQRERFWNGLRVYEYYEWFRIRISEIVL